MFYNQNVRPICKSTKEIQHIETAIFSHNLFFIYRAKRWFSPVMSKQFANVEWINWKNNYIISIPTEYSTDVNNFFKKVIWDIHVPSLFPLVHHGYIFQNLTGKHKICNWALPAPSSLLRWIFLWLWFWLGLDPAGFDIFLKAILQSLHAYQWLWVKSKNM